MNHMAELDSLLLTHQLPPRQLAFSERLRQSGWEIDNRVADIKGYVFFFVLFSYALLSPHMCSLAQV